jgi:hypothetical protein
MKTENEITVVLIKEEGNKLRVLSLGNPYETG